MDIQDILAQSYKNTIPVLTRSWYTNKSNTSFPLQVQGIDVIDVDQSTLLPYSPTTFSTQKKRKKRLVNEDIEEIRSDTDTLNKLPDDILIYLLSFLDIKTACRTSCLSKRWRNLWTHIPDLDFKDPDNFNKESLGDSSKGFTSRGFSYGEWVDRVTTVHRAPIINSMRIQFPFDRRSQIGKGLSLSCRLHWLWRLESQFRVYFKRWIEFGLRRKIVKLELNLAMAFASELERYSSFYYDLRRPNLYHFDISWKSPYLKSLHLEALYIDGPLVEKVLSNCLNLERLIVKSCVFKSFNALHPDRSESMAIRVSSLKLKYLELDRCNTKLLQIYGPNLTSLLLFPFSITRIASKSIPEVECTSGPSLVDVTFASSYCFRIFHTSGFSSLGLTKLTLFWEELCFHKDNIIALISVIEACPLLHTFTLEMYAQHLCVGFSEVEMYVENAIAHQHLKLIEIVGCDQFQSIHKLVFCLTHPMHTPKLKKVILDPCPQQCLYKFVQFECCHFIKLARENFKLIAKQIPEGVDVVIL